MQSSVKDLHLVGTDSLMEKLVTPRVTYEILRESLRHPFEI